jgi:hypothetical protein
MDDISIDRLIFDLPGLTPEQARDVARKVGESLAALAKAPASFDTLRVDLNQQADGKDVPRLANAIVSSLLRQMD